MQDRRNQPSSRTNEPSSRARGRGRGGPNRRGTTSGPSRGTPGPRTQQISSFPGLQNARSPVATPQASIYEASRRRMNLMASVSRSSGLEKDGDDLKNPNIQEEYRSFIQGKVGKILQDRSRSTSESEVEKGHRIEAQQNVLILFRKLREGVASTNRRDRFALEVYETSLYLSVLFESPAQTVSILPHLFLSRSSEKVDEPTFTSGSPSICAALCALFHQLVAYYPSQGPYMQQLQALSKIILTDSALSQWLQGLTRSLRTRNYARFSRLSDCSAVNDVLDAPIGASEYDLGLQATLVLMNTLRRKVSESAWTIIRAAYRELSTDDGSAETRGWLEHSLCLASLEKSNSSHDLSVNRWLESRESMGHVRRKEDVNGRWLICKVR
ncbi:hypothetical protein D9619_007356 [Psilocybe cf. subviscida]|uniref:Uncharacterized protein n=1 Tax=Psilocybe cf. subviscida TaxID=2480587 RepID=A0A8H5EWN9_9AGAR|nr:hypothetical protein D9619_007356 [Psilocybe cf. subviscida]